MNVLLSFHNWKSHFANTKVFHKIAVTANKFNIIYYWILFLCMSMYIFMCICVFYVCNLFVFFLTFSWGIEMFSGGIEMWHWTKTSFFFYLGCFFHNHRTAGEGGGISLTPHYRFHPLHRHLDISQAITAESSPLHIASSWTPTGNLCFPSASR